MKDKYTDVEKWLLATLSIVLIVLLVFGFALKCFEDRVSEPTTSHSDVYNAPPPNVEVESVVIEPIVVEPICPPTVELVEPPKQEPIVVEARSGETSFVKVGFAFVESALFDADIGICSWADIILSEDEMNLLRTTVYCEAGNQDLDTQVMVALTVLNRLNAGYAEDIRGVIYAENAYAVTKWSNFEDRGWTEQVKNAVDIALSVNEHPDTMFYFRTEYYHKFQGAINYVKSGDLYFSTK